MTPAEREALDWINSQTSYTQNGDGPWERSFVRAGTAARSRVLRRLAEAGLVEMQEARGTKGAPSFRSIEALTDEERADLGQRHERFASVRRTW